MKQTVFFLTLILVAVLFGAADIFAQTQAPPPPALPPDLPQAPIDGGLGLLLAGGSYYAFRKLKKNKIN